MPKKKITDTYTKVYKLRTAGDDGRTIEVSMPREVVVKEARKRGMTLEEFIQRYRAIAHYNAFDGVFYGFEPVSSLTELPDFSRLVKKE